MRRRKRHFFVPRLFVRVITCRSITAAALFIGAGLLSPGRSCADDLTRLSGDTMGTTWSVVVGMTEAPIDAAELSSQIQQTLDDIDRQMSTWRDDSEISRFNATTSTDWFDVSPETAIVVSEAVATSEQTGGAFDVTVGPLIDLWHFGSNDQEFTIPSDQQIESARQVTGWQQLESRLDPPAIRKRIPELRINLSAIAKGFAVDQVGDLLSDSGAVTWLVEIGGEIQTQGRKPDGSKWTVAVEAPVVGLRMEMQRLELEDQALATSGDYRNFFEIDGKRYSHTIDPRTGRPVEHGLTSVTVSTDSCMTADALATSFMVLGPDDGYNLAETLKIPALFVVRDGDGFRRLATAEYRTTQFNDEAPSDSAGPVSTFVVTLIVFLVAVTAMAVGVIVANRQLRGSCGGLNNTRDEHGELMCGLCSNPAPDCRVPWNRQAASSNDEAESTSSETASD